MPRLPSANDLGRIGYDTRAAIPSGFSDNIGPAVRRLGATLGGIGEDLAAEQKKTDKEAEAQQEYADNLRFVQWRDQQNQAFTEATRTAPEGASGFTANWIKQYDEGAREFIGQVPAPLKQTFDAKLFTERQQLLSRAQTFERNAGDAATLRGLSTSLDTLKKQITTDPDKADQYIAEGRRLIEGAPLPTEDRVKQFDDWKKDGSLAVITRRLEAGVYAPVSPVGGASAIPGDAASLMSRLIAAESGGNPNAVSPKGAIGLAQIMPGTSPEIARDLGDQNFPYNNPEQIRDYLKDPAVSARYGTRYLQKQMDRYGGDAKAALIAYNAGPKRADEWVASGKNDAVLPAETRSYVAKILGGGMGAPALDLGPDTQLTAGSFASRHYTWQDLRNDRWSSSTVSSRAVNALDWVTDQFGSKLKITSGYRAPNHPAERAKVKPGQHSHGQAIDIDVSGMSDADKSRLVSLFVQTGAVGLGHYPPGSSGAGTIHVDFRQSRGKQADGLALWYGRQGAEAGEGWFKSGIEQGRAARGGSGPSFASNAYLDRSRLEADPHYKALDYETQQRVINAYEADAKRRASEAMVAARASLEPRVADAQVAFETQGRYDGQVPTLKDFTDAYGPQEGADRYDDFAQKVVVGEEVFGLRLTPNAQIVQAVEAAKPASAGEGIADQQARYETIAKAADLILKQREADPVGFVMQNVPAVREAWDGVERGAVPYSQALQATTAAQQAIGIPASKIQPLPKQQAAAIEGVWKNTEAPEADRIGAVTSALFSTPDPDQRRAVFKQLVDAGLPEYVEGALQAFERGDQGAARRLMQAALVDPTKLPGKLAAKPSEIDEGIQNQLLAEGSVGDIYYGLADGAVENYEKARRDATLLNRAVMMRLTGGEDLETAVEGAGKDLFGNVVPLPEDSRVNAQVLIPAEADPEPVINMLQAYKRTVAMTLSGLARDEIERTDAASGNRAVLETVVQNRIEDIMENGYFVERNGGYVFMDPYTGLPVATADGEPLVMDKAGPSGTDTPPPASAIEPQAPVQGLLGEAVPDMGPVEAEALRQLMGTE